VQQQKKKNRDKTPSAVVATLSALSKGREPDQAHRPAQLKTKERAKRAAPAPLTIPTRNDSDPRREAIDRRRAVLRALEVIASSSRVLDPKHGPARRVGVE
jgi:hypothetical protein